MIFFRQPRFRILLPSAFIFAAALLLGLLARHISAALAAENATKPAMASPVIVELFTSEGCSSCPPADALLAQLDREQPVPGAQIIALEEHVDYWDHLGWKDRFSSPYITARQQLYTQYFNLDDQYTPQIVVNGSSQFNGTDKAAIENAIGAAGSRPVPLKMASFQLEHQHGNIRLENLDSPYTGYVRVYVALLDPADMTEVRAGENNGKTLHHAAVVRYLALAGESFHMNSIAKLPIRISPPAGQNLEGMRLVVFVQKKPTGPILAALSCTIAPTSHAQSSPESCRGSDESAQTASVGQP